MQQAWAALTVTIALLAAAGPAGAQTCDVPIERSHVVTRVDSGDTLLLDDGGEVVLIGALPPISFEQEAGGPNTGEQAQWPPAERSRAALDALVRGQSVDLAVSGRRLDRYGRQYAHVFVQRGTERVWLQGQMIANGYARAYALPGSDGCIEPMIALEQQARASGVGHWATGIFQDRIANEPRALLGFRGSFQTVEGRIERTNKVRGQQVFDFSSDPRTGFSVWMAPKSNRRGRAGWAMAPADLVGRRVRVRGWLEGRRGPTMTLDDPRLIEVLDDRAKPDQPVLEPPIREPRPEDATAQGQPVPIPAAHP